MNTGADDDSRKTPTFAVRSSSARAANDAATVAVSASKLANRNGTYPDRELRTRACCVIQFPPCTIRDLPSLDWSSDTRSRQRPPPPSPLGGGGGRGGSR